MADRFRITDPLTPRERLADLALGVIMALIVVVLVGGTVVLALLGAAA